MLIHFVCYFIFLRTIKPFSKVVYTDHKVNMCLLADEKYTQTILFLFLRFVNSNATEVEIGSIFRELLSLVHFFIELLVNRFYMVLCVGDARLLLFSFELS